MNISASPAPAHPIEPSDARHQAYSFSQNFGARRGSTDPLLHASMAASATANMQHSPAGVGSSSGAAPGGPSASGSSESPFMAGAARKRSIASAMLDGPDHYSGAGTASPGSQAHRFSHPFASSSSFKSDGTGGNHTLPPLSAEDGRRPSLSSLAGYNFGSWDPNNSNPFGNFATTSSSAANGSVTAAAPTAPDSQLHYYGQSGPAASSGPYASRSSSLTSQHHMAGGSFSESVDGKAPLPYARSPELRVSHKLAERKRRKEMKDLFDDLKGLLPNVEEDKDRSKLSKWEVLTKAIDHISSINFAHQHLMNEVQSMRSRLHMPPYEVPQMPEAADSSSASPHSGGYAPPPGHPRPSLGSNGLNGTHK